MKTIATHITIPAILLALILAFEAQARSRHPASQISLYSLAFPPAPSFRNAPPELRP